MKHFSNPIKLYRVSDDVIDYYRLNVTGNSNTDKTMIIKKLTRNALLGKRLYDIEGYEDKQLFQYGELLIITDPITYSIVEISNYSLAKPSGWTKNARDYAYLNRVLGISLS